jgi:NAD(P)-dependent dehydrogenase (short-subunit alcohol dehydrogenase family)
MSDDKPKTMPPEQLARRPGRQTAMKQKPQSINQSQRGSGKLAGKAALITGGDSGIGRAVAIAFAREGADIAIAYLEEHEDAKQTVKLVKAEGRECYGWAGDLGDESFCKQLVADVIAKYGRLDILVNNAAEQHPQKKLTDISAEQLERTFRSNVFAMFYLTKAALPHLREGSTIINTSSITAYKGNPRLLDYSSTKGAISAFSRSLALNLADQGIRVNSVAPGPIWTPLIPSTFDADSVKQFGKDTALGRAGQPEELSGAYVYLAGADSSYVTGQTIHVNGGQIING